MFIKHFRQFFHPKWFPHSIIDCPSKNGLEKKVPETSDIVNLPQRNCKEKSMGRSKLTIETNCKHTHFTWGERLVLQYHYTGTNGYKKIISPTLLGILLSKHPRTISRELRRGQVEHKNSDLTTSIVYNSEFAQRDAESQHTAKGPNIKLGKDWELANMISKLIKEDKYSPYAIVEHFKRTKWPSNTVLSEKTIYNYIVAGDIPGITIKDLLYKGKRFKPKGRPKKHSNALNASKSIEKRPKEANERSEVGHWEMDTVYSGKNCSKDCLLTLTERMTKAEIIRKIPDRTAASVTTEIDKLERQIGSTKFRRMFKSITPDNGVEFSDAAGIEQSVLCKSKRTELFYAHPYCSYERGTNENHNGIIRRFIAKGSDIGLVKKNNIREIQDWMNNYPRRILGGRSPLKAVSEEFGLDFSIPQIMEVRI
jgi:IS30 family transposase